MIQLRRRKRLRVLLLQLDGKLPSVALMRIAAHHRDRGDIVEYRSAPGLAGLTRNLGEERADLVYASTIFTWTRPLVDELRALRPDAIIGGTGADRGKSACERATLEKLGIGKRQDYSIYPRYTASIGYSQRGCRLKCGFCDVWRAEPVLVEENTIADLWRGDPWPRHLHLLDNDFLGQPRWRAQLDAIRSGGFKVCFNQGINARLIKDAHAREIASVDYRDQEFEERRLYVAWDNVGDEDDLFRGLECLKRAGVSPADVIVYMLVGFVGEGLPPGPIVESDLYREKKIREWGAQPYPMPYRDGVDDARRDLAGFLRWSLRWSRSYSWAQFVEADYQPRNLTKPDAAHEAAQRRLFA